jgi:hypothetical protein
VKKRGSKLRKYGAGATKDDYMNKIRKKSMIMRENVRVKGLKVKKSLPKVEPFNSLGRSEFRKTDPFKNLSG